MEIIKKYWKIMISSIIIAAIALLLINTKKEKTEIIEQPEEINEIKEIKEVSEEPKKIKIDIKGEVNEPGVYELEEGNRVSDAIKIANGLTEYADTELINLSKNLKDEMVIIIYNKNEIEKIKTEQPKIEKVIEYIEKECKCPDKINDACINESDTKEQTKEENTENKISINTAELEELKKIPGLGESKAKSIIEYRQKNGKFEKIEDITNVSGIGKTTFEKLKDYITI